MAKGLIPMKIVFYLIFFAIIMFLVIIFMNDIGLKVYNFTLPDSTKYVPIPQTSEDITITNVAVLYNNADITDGILIKNDASDVTFSISFIANMPDTINYPAAGVDVNFIFQSQNGEYDFNNCLVTKHMAPGNTAIISTESCAGGGLVLKTGSTGPVYVKISARVEGVAKATGYGHFTAYRTLSSLPSNMPLKLCDAIKNLNTYPFKKLYIMNDGASGILLDKKTLSSFETILTVDGTDCTDVKIFCSNLFGSCTNFASNPDLRLSNGFTLKKGNGFSIIPSKITDLCGTDYCKVDVSYLDSNG